MGFPGHFNIPGHSGTDQKHKKAFTKWRKWQREDALSYESERKSSQRTGQYKSEHEVSRTGRKWLLILGLPVVLLALACSGWLIFQAGDGMMSSFEQPLTISLTPQTDAERLRSYDHFRRLGNQALEEGHHEAARVNFTHALTLAPYSKNARVGLTLVLEHYCVENERYCDEAKEQRRYMKKMGWGEDVYDEYSALKQ